MSAFFCGLMVAWGIDYLIDRRWWMAALTFAFAIFDAICWIGAA